MRLLKAALVFFVGGLGFLTFLTNVTNAQDAYAAVAMALGMESTFGWEGLTWRAIDTPALAWMAFAIIVLMEGVVALLGFIGAWTIFAAREATAERFHEAKRPGLAACAVGMILWNGGFIVIGGEWFALWQTGDFNPVPAAFRFATMLAAIAIFVAMRDTD